MKLSMDSLPGLVLFGKVVSQGSLSGAAKSLGLTRSAISKQLAAFEKQLGTPLLQRTTRKLVLTEFGSQVLQESRLIESSLQSVERMTDQFQSEIRGTLKIACLSGIGHSILIPLLSEFHAVYPALHIELTLEDHLTNLTEQQIDVAIRSDHLADSSLVTLRLGTLNKLLIASPAYIKKMGAPASPEELAHHQCVTYRSRKHTNDLWCFEDTLTSHQIKVPSSITLNNTNALISAALNGLGILLIDKVLVNEHIQSGALIQVLPDFIALPSTPLYAVHPAREHTPAKTTAFVNFLLEKLSPIIV